MTPFIKTENQQLPIAERPLKSIHKHIKLFIKYIKNIKNIRQSWLCSAHLEMKWGPWAKGVQNNKQTGRISVHCLLWRCLDRTRHIAPTALLVRVVFSREDLYKVVEWPSTRPKVLSMITWSYLRRRRRLTIFEPDETKFASEFVD